MRLKIILMIVVITFMCGHGLHSQSCNDLFTGNRITTPGGITFTCGSGSHCHSYTFYVTEGGKDNPFPMYYGTTDQFYYMERTDQRHYKDVCGIEIEIGTPGKGTLLYTTNWNDAAKIQFCEDHSAITTVKNNWAIEFGKRYLYIGSESYTLWKYKNPSYENYYFKYEHPDCHTSYVKGQYITGAYERNNSGANYVFSNSSWRNKNIKDYSIYEANQDIICNQNLNVTGKKVAFISEDEIKINESGSNTLTIKNGAQCSMLAKNGVIINKNFTVEKGAVFGIFCTKNLSTTKAINFENVAIESSP